MRKGKKKLKLESIQIESSNQTFLYIKRCVDQLMDWNQLLIIRTDDRHIHTHKYIVKEFIYFQFSIHYKSYFRRKTNFFIMPPKIML